MDNEALQNLTIPEMYALLEKCGIAVRKNLSSAKLKSICEESMDQINKALEVIAKKEAEAPELHKTPPEPAVSSTVSENESNDKDNSPPTPTTLDSGEDELPGVEGAELTFEQKLNKLYSRREALRQKAIVIQEEIKQMVKGREESAVLTLNDMLEISRNENKTSAALEPKLTPEEERVLSRQFARKRANQEQFNNVPK